MKNSFSKYLPSKKFTLIMGTTLGAILFLFVIFYLVSGKTVFVSSANKNPLALEGRTVTDLMGADSDLDGIPDWEEALWGTDKNKKATFDGIPDATYIANRKKEMKIEQGEIREIENLTETEKFAREFFQSFVALKASGEVDETTINSFSSALGQKIVNPSLADSFSKEKVKIAEEDTPTSRLNYYLEIKALFDKQKEEGLGEELQIISEGLVNSSSTNHEDLLVISEAYKNFALAMMEVAVPESLIPRHLDIANNANKTGLAVANMQKMILDPIVGLAGLSEYQKYSVDLVKAVTELEAIL